jgi:DNA primase
MPLVDREEILARIDLEELATDVCGQPRGGGRSARWHCPSPGHPDRNPSMGIYTARTGVPRWKCHACGEGGTAIDLLMISTSDSAGDVIRALARRAGITVDDSHRAPRPRARPRPAPTSPVPIALEPHPAVEELVDKAARLLWGTVGDYARRHLRRRGLSDEVLRANRVGFDPGPGMLPRPEGLPASGPGVVFPVLHPITGAAVYYQLRSLSPRTASDVKYLPPRAEIAPNPRLAAVRGLGEPAAPGLLVICEGFPDALTAVQAGLPALAVLGVGHAGRDNAAALAEQISIQHPRRAYAVCFDNDDRAREPAIRLAGHLARTGATVARLLPPRARKDLNEWWQADPEAVTRELTGAVKLLLPQPSVAAVPPLPELSHT